MAFFVREMAVRARGIVDHECDFDKTSEEIYQDLCVDQTSLEVLKHFNIRKIFDDKGGISQLIGYEFKTDIELFLNYIEAQCYSRNYYFLLCQRIFDLFLKQPSET